MGVLMMGYASVGANPNGRNPLVLVQPTAWVIAATQQKCVMKVVYQEHGVRCAAKTAQTVSMAALMPRVGVMGVVSRAGLATNVTKHVLRTASLKNALRKQEFALMVANLVTGEHFATKDVRNVKEIARRVMEHVKHNVCQDFGATSVIQAVQRTA